uniref:Tobamovirus multiplication protein 1-like n=1 Tax=Tanacetum cinerariifolium TaxID=118510 RepID=A0A6L2J9I3_TANCI|nr:tobamovirus multiplication protein 1-like [Tanacetum cinerariifolium]
MTSSYVNSKTITWLSYISSSGGNGESINLVKGWWNGVDESRKWQDGVFYALCASYALVSLIALVQLVRIQMRVPEYGWTTQKVFHLMNFVVNGLRAVQFGFYWKVFHTNLKVLDMILLDLPGLLFFSTYTLLVLFWAEIYHQARSLPTEKLRPAYFVINGIVYFFQICIWIYMRFSKTAVAVEVAELFFSFISLGAAVGFMVYGGRLFVMLRRFPIESRGRQKKLHEVGFVTGICCTCFLIRCVMVAIAAFNKNADMHVLNHPILDFFYYMIVEILPSALVLFILRKLPPRRVSDQYHPIK